MIWRSAVSRFFGRVHKAEFRQLSRLAITMSLTRRSAVRDLAVTASVRHEPMPCCFAYAGFLTYPALPSHPPPPPPTPWPSLVRRNWRAQSPWPRSTRPTKAWIRRLSSTNLSCSLWVIERTSISVSRDAARALGIRVFNRSADHLGDHIARVTRRPDLCRSRARLA
jgi:hypothetical protein